MDNVKNREMAGDNKKLLTWFKDVITIKVINDRLMMG